jgi:DNA-binding NarL/FixJ family response regulator
MIADDHRLFREGIINLLNEAKDILVVEEVENEVSQSIIL